jgi:UDP-hydrolysing UDP-N-acetyl-D-glucosamine 2-epimerase
VSPVEDHARRVIAVVSVARSDYGLLTPVLHRIRGSASLQLRLIVAGAHLSRSFGDTASVIEADGFTIDDRIETLSGSDTPEGIAVSVARAVEGSGRAFGRARPDILLLLGDRYEMLGAAAAALPYAIPIAHVHGGELSEGAIDDAVRHALTKMSHLHFASTEAYARRIVQMGEEPWRVQVTGAPGLDTMRMTTLLDRAAAAEALGMPADRWLLATFHPSTLEGDAAGQVNELCQALDACGLPVLFTYPGADAGGSAIVERLTAYVHDHPDSRLVTNLGTPLYFSAMRHAAAMVGNSSSGIIEAASFSLPVVNIGARQRGRVRPGNVIDVGGCRDEIVAGLERALSPEFRRGCAGRPSPYGDGHAAERIVATLEAVTIDQRLIMKRFHDVANA